jgi:hypothetical protein
MLNQTEPATFSNLPFWLSLGIAIFSVAEFNKYRLQHFQFCCVGISSGILFYSISLSVLILHGINQTTKMFKILNISIFIIFSRKNQAFCEFSK